MLKLKSGTVILFFLCTSTAYAAVETGTGQPEVNLTIDGNQAVIQMTTGDTTALGRLNLEQGYGQAILDALNNGQLQPGWGRVEVLQGCGTADVIVYQTVNGEETEAWVGQVVNGVCE